MSSLLNYTNRLSEITAQPIEERFRNALEFSSILQSGHPVAIVSVAELDTIFPYLSDIYSSPSGLHMFQKDFYKYVEEGKFSFIVCSRGEDRPILISTTQSFLDTPPSIKECEEILQTSLDMINNYLNFEESKKPKSYLQQELELRSKVEQDQSFSQRVHEFQSEIFTQAGANSFGTIYHYITEQQIPNFHYLVSHFSPLTEKNLIHFGIEDLKSKLLETLKSSDPNKPKMYFVLDRDGLLELTFGFQQKTLIDKESTFEHKFPKLQENLEIEESRKKVQKLRKEVEEKFSEVLKTLEELSEILSKK